MLKNKTKILLIILLVIIGIGITIYLFLNKNRDIGEDIKGLIPSKYTIIEKGKEGKNGCTLLYTVYPKEFSEIQLKYLEIADIQYCKNINTLILMSQTGPIIYNKEKDEWIFSDGTKADEKVTVGKKRSNSCKIT